MKKKKKSNVGIQPETRKKISVSLKKHWKMIRLNGSKNADHGALVDQVLNDIKQATEHVDGAGRIRRKR